MKEKDTDKKAKFFCESCGAEVPQNARVCVYCGKFFSAVRCPKCGKTGSTADFEDGCPECGYAVNKSNDTQNGENKTKNISSKKIGTKERRFFSKTKKAPSSSSLPLWIYIVIIVALVALVIGMYSCLEL